MALAPYLVAVPVEASKRAKTSVLTSSSSSNEPMSSLALTSSSLLSKARNLSIFPRIHRIIHKAKAEPRESEVSLAADAFTHFKHLLLPVTDRNPYLSEGTRQAAATTAALAKKYGADITVVGMSYVHCPLSIPFCMYYLRTYIFKAIFQELRTLCSLQLLMKNRKRRCQSMKLNWLAFAGISLKVDFRNSNCWSDLEKEASLLPSLVKLLMT
ncbi:hypothetical protein CRYUN_Cryun24cG0005100 [Craigia yunnanensis]